MIARSISQMDRSSNPYGVLSPDPYMVKKLSMREFNRPLITLVKDASKRSIK
jgi:hypothetical protein